MSQVTYYQRNREAILNARKKKNKFLSEELK